MSVSKAEPMYLTVKQVAERFNVSESWVRLHSRPGEIPHYRPCGVIRYDADEVDAWFRSRGAVLAPKPPEKIRSKGLKPLENFNIERLRRKWNSSNVDAPNGEAPA
jgi:excisionase family DNA binding protein